MIRKNMSRCKRETASVFYETIVKPLRAHVDGFPDLVWIEVCVVLARWPA